MADPDNKQIVIRGLTSAGKTFRPSDWAERLAGVLSIFDIDSRLNYSPLVQPTSVDGIKSIVVSSQLETLDNRAWSFLMDFARDNDLVVADYIRQS